ncbi:1-acyl-sn-glycerol-3-phosphate acyltransferase [Bacillus atrophaeus]|uniref:lysophospholipid acyltransferase family protein n=1 Tax=Bacillus atrophaeus TaxID=1452 RepID=UPI0003311AB8|nr:1-acyl-sn-glycerol-3-phosphate acyltransferase [Bacillus atrophaeus]AKL84847.1 YpkP [Bacillus atrophaeus UCMB-5137]QUF63700.1 1-acyl-sn-glycerol-3-phosphate acyltransferase [Bacillus atrophaeus]WFE12572.1 1-acyl-sn-glycerol-3-phosphate acyltransferase [Bacillus atrophaeus]
MIRFCCLVIYIVYMLVKNIKQLFNLTMIDPRLSYEKQMKLVYEQPKAFMRGCIDVSGSVITINQTESIPNGPVLYVHSHLRTADLVLLAGHVPGPVCFIASPKAFRIPFMGKWLERMNVIREEGNPEVMHEYITEHLQKGQSMLLSRKGSADPEEIAARLNLPIVMVETEGTDHLLRGTLFKRLKTSEIEMSFNRVYYPAEQKQLRA